MSDKRLRFYYGDHPSQFGDLRVPDGPGPHRIVVVIHGGFWYDQYGLDLMDDFSEDLTERGFATWNIEYRRVGEEGGGWPGTVEDVFRAVDHLQVLAREYPLDTTRITTVGHSAGGHLSLLVAARGRTLEEETRLATNLQKPAVSVQGVISLAGVCDLRRMWEVRQMNSPVVDFLGDVPDRIPEVYLQASPIERLPIGVLQVLIHGTADDRVPLELSDRYYHRGMELGDPVTFIELPDIEHFKLINPRSEAWPPIVEALEELYRMMG